MPNCCRGGHNLVSFYTPEILFASQPPAADADEAALVAALVAAELAAAAATATRAAGCQIGEWEDEDGRGDMA